MYAESEVADLLVLIFGACPNTDIADDKMRTIALLYAGNYTAVVERIQPNSSCTPAALMIAVCDADRPVPQVGKLLDEPFFLLVRRYHLRENVALTARRGVLQRVADEKHKAIWSGENLSLHGVPFLVIMLLASLVQVMDQIQLDVFKVTGSVKDYRGEIVKQKITPFSFANDLMQPGPHPYR